MSTARPYDSPLRAEQMEQTRRRILQALADVLADEAVDEVTVPVVAMRDQSGLDGGEAGRAAAWAVRVLTDELRRNPASIKEKG